MSKQANHLQSTQRQVSNHFLVGKLVSFRDLYHACARRQLSFEANKLNRSACLRLDRPAQRISGTLCPVPRTVEQQDLAEGLRREDAHVLDTERDLHE